MKQLDYDNLKDYINTNIDTFHNGKLGSLEKLNLKKILKRKNPYLFRAKNVMRASDLVEGILDAYLSSSEEKNFGDFLEDLAIFVASLTCDGKKSGIKGIDLEFTDSDCKYLVSIKSGPNWGNNSQKERLRDYFTKAVITLKQSKHAVNVQPVLGICYGKSKSVYIHNYMQVMGQSFWYLISGDENLYKDLIEPVGYKAKEHNNKFEIKKDMLVNKLIKEVLDDFCDDGVLLWDKLVEFNSGNLDKTFFAG